MRARFPVKWVCPFSNERLHELYWKEGKTPAEIGKLAQEVLEREKAPDWHTVGRWLIAAGITLRGHAEASRIAALPQVRAKSGMWSAEAQSQKSRTISARVRSGMNVLPQPHRPGKPLPIKTRRAISQAAKDKPRAQTIRLTCDYCHEEFDMPLHRFKSCPNRKHVFCKREHFLLHAKAFRGIQLREQSEENCRARRERRLWPQREGELK